MKQRGGKRAEGVMERRRREKNGERKQRVHERRQGVVPFPAEPDSANGQLVALREQFRGPY